MSQIWRGMSGGIEVLENVNEMADLPDISTIDSEGVWYIESGEFAPDYIAPTNWDSTAGEFTDWFSLFDGRILVDIPDSDIYLQDDFGDDKLSDRDGSGTTTYNGVEGVYRPEWTQDGDTPTVDNGILSVDSDTQMFTGINLNFDEKISWVADVDISGGSGGDDVAWSLFAQTTDWGFNGDRAMVNSYLLEFEPDRIRIQKNIDASTGDTMVSMTSGIPDNPVIEVTRSPSGEFELFVDDESQGTNTDTDYDDDDIDLYTGFGAESGGYADVNEIKVS